MNIDFLITSFVALFVIIDPIGLTPLFVALTQGMSAKARRKITIRAIGVAFFVLMLFALFGETVLGFVGISMPAFHVAGGILLFLTALDMLFQRRTKRREDQSEEEADDPSVFPLAIPLIAGPGSIATIILIAGAKPGPIGLASAGLVALAGLITVFIFFSTADGLEKLLGKTGIDVVTRLLGMLLAALSIQFISEGFFAFLPANGGAV
jgi:multiple antibiotic resistance protein